MSDYPQLLWEKDLVVISKPIINNQRTTCEGCPFNTVTGGCDNRGYTSINCIEGPCYCVLVQLEVRN